MRITGRHSATWCAVVAVAAAVSVLAACGSAGVPSTTAPADPPAPAATSTTAAAPTPTVTASTTAAGPAPTVTVSTPTVTASTPVAAARIGFLEIHRLVPDALVDLRYATDDNTFGTRLYPRTARCLVHRSMAHGLEVAAARLRAVGLRLVFWDCYRPHAVQVRMFRIVPDPVFVARPGPYSRSHETGRSVDVTLAASAPARRCPHGIVAGHCLADMGTGFDSFTAQAAAYASTGLSAAQLRERRVLRAAMSAGGLAAYAGEWWHFDGPGATVRRAIVDVALT